ncbi:glutamate-cysteine ligase [Stemphylium lycopersici]|uniref:Glutamate--cysteine ligase n=1 Tax=Stemphylium lycopersici TaxID=183478 RepID=A0A364MTQ5_STELY|nr:glutamate-cysteine ligase [Stemphylium lycopersici]RAR03189.1 glutamate-cysteine ligase [Stemphylium lycopersici]
MEPIDAGSRQAATGLPSINHMDADRVKRGEVEYQRKHSAAPMPSPLHPYAGSSHLHSNHQSSVASTVPGSLGGLLSPPESRRTSGDERETQRATARQSLPSIHEALGGSEQPLSYPATVPPPSSITSAPQHYHPSSAAPSPAEQRPRQYPPDLQHAGQGPSNPFSHPRSPYLASSAPQAGPPPPPAPVHTESLPRPPFSDPRPPYSTPQHNPKLPSLHPIKTAQSPPPSATRPNPPYSSYPPPASNYESSAPQSAGPMNHQQHYPHYPPSYPSSAPSASTPNSAYPPSASTYSAPPRYAPQSWQDNSEMARLEEKKIGRSSLAPYGESVKRHLESFDIDASLNEMADGSGRISEFSKIYRQRAHENQRIGMTPQSMPRLEEVDEMLKQAERIQMSLQRMRDVVLNHHQASIVEPTQDPRYRPMNGYDDSGSNYGDDTKGMGGFAGGDNKTRKRGRAAPPGRCHSCNRAETPEWRRGPDGARTLCNACGLHYAKLTRKMGGKQAMTSSNLRPKPMEHGSPTMTWEWVCCEIRAMPLAVLANAISSALGTPLDWPDAKKAADQVRSWGIEQLLAIWRNAKGKERDALLWGDEVPTSACPTKNRQLICIQIEYLVVCYDQDNHKVRLSLRQADILAALANDEKLLQQGGGVPDLQTGNADAKDNPAPVFHPEFGRFMLEATPGKPWGIGFKDLLDVEPNMKWRRTIAKDHMAQTEFPITLTTFPRLGSADCIVPSYPVSGPKLRSQFVPDEIANPHIRFPTLAANIRWRRGRKVEVNVPVFRDEKTTWPWKDPTVNYDMHNWPEDDDVRNGAAKENHIHMDAMAFGMGSCCLQITFQAKNIGEGRKMYDQLSPIAPILLALTAATPIYKGFLANTDVRWNQISRAVDDRTPEELDPRLRPEYLDPDLIIDANIKKRLVEGGMDDLLATHFAHLFIRDPIVVFAEDLEELDLTKADHFENLQSTNWQHMRFKPPPAGSDMGWRVEFRPMEIQITDFENAAFSIFIVLLTRAILSFNLNFYIPITLVSENMETAHIRDAVSTQKFWFRKDPFSTHKPSNGTGTSTPTENGSRTATPTGPVEDEYEQMTINEVINGQQTLYGNAGFPGLIPLVESYLNSMNVDVETRCDLATYLDLIRKRANGTYWTAAKWIRNFVQSHPEYKKDSVVSDEITYDLVKAAEQITKEEGRDGLGKEMLGKRR